MTGAHERLLAIFGRFKQANSVAWLHTDGDLTFAALHASAQTLADSIAAFQDGDRSPVLILGHKDRRFPIAYWAGLILGRPVVPVEPDTPSERLLEIAQLAKAGLLLVAQPQAPSLPALACPVMEVSVCAASGVDPARRPIRIRDRDACYIMFSSGTTGAAKGIQISYANVVDFLSWLGTLHSQFGVPSAVTGTVRHCFDVSLYELWTSWLQTVPLSTLDHRDFSHPASYLDRLKAHATGWWVSTPSMLRYFLKCQDFNAVNLPELRTFVFCGEVLTKENVASLWRKFPTARVFNSYGPTECTVAVTGIEILPSHLASQCELPIGVGRPGTRLLLRPDPSIVQAGQPAQGEIIITGRSVGLGYLNQPERQAAQFPDLLTYNTGDQGSCGADGVWYFHGRRDREVKIQGIRVDLNTVESSIRLLDGVEDVVVDVLTIRGEPRALNAYVLGPDSADELAIVARSLARTVSPYLVPRKWYACSKAALNHNGKLDRGELVSVARASAVQHVQAVEALSI